MDTLQYLPAIENESIAGYEPTAIDSYSLCGQTLEFATPDGHYSVSLGDPRVGEPTKVHL